MVSFYSNSKYVAIIGDIIASRTIAERKAMQNKFIEVLSTINQKYAEDIVSDFTITLGDEFQGLLKNRSNIMNIVLEIEMALAPIEFRFGIGLGDVSTEIGDHKSFEIDGSAYHRARKMINEITNTQKQYSEKYTNIMISSEDANNEVDELLNATLSVCSALKSKWTKRQKEIIYAYLNNGENQYKTAQHLGISQPSVNKALNNSRFYSYRFAVAAINHFLVKSGDEND